MSAIDWFNYIFESNKDTICIPEDKRGIYSINQEKVQQYIQSNCIEEVHPLLNFIFENIQYIDFNMFYSSLTNYVMEINRVHRNGDNDMVIQAILIVPEINREIVQKSNFWISLLIKKIIIDNNILNFEIVNICNILEFQNYCNEYNLGDNFIGIFPDDCSYSGQQSGDYLFSHKLSMANKIYVLIPYISNYAYAIYKLKAKYLYGESFPNNIVFLENCIHSIKTFTELCVEKQFNMFKNDVYYLSENHYTDMMKGGPYIIRSFIKDILLLPECGLLIYFDHKIADQVSTIQYFLNYSVILNNVYIATNILTNVDDVFEEYSNKQKRFINNYLNKPINVFSDELKNHTDYVVLQLIKSGVKYNLGNAYNNFYKGLINKHKEFTKKTCNTDVIYYSVINNCENKPFYNALENEDEDTLIIIDFDLNKKKDENGVNYICPVTFYKQPNFYKNIMSGGTNYIKYINTKKQYLKLKKIKN